MASNSLTLLELHTRIKESFRKTFPSAIWITSEISEMHDNRSGHCYLQLAEKDKTGEKILATSRATIWSSNYMMIKTQFGNITRRPLTAGLKVMFKVEVVFHVLYGYSLNVIAVDPSYTLGDIERRRREIIERLTNEGVIDMNKLIPFPDLPKNIAVISSQTAAGYGDFMEHIQNNTFGYKFNVKLFPAIMQGDNTRGSVIAALDSINEYVDFFDVVVIIRGGGSQTDLSYFDDYEIALNIAQFPLPIISGIGHERDVSIVDLVANLRVKTPTAAAILLINRFQIQDNLLSDYGSRLKESVETLTEKEYNFQNNKIILIKHLFSALLSKHKTSLVLLSQKSSYGVQALIKGQDISLSSYFADLKNLTSNKINIENMNFSHIILDIKKQSNFIFASSSSLLEIAETKMKYANPDIILKRGFSITRVNGKAIASISNLKLGDNIETKFSDGNAISEINKINLKI